MSNNSGYPGWQQPTTPLPFDVWIGNFRQTARREPSANEVHAAISRGETFGPSGNPVAGYGYQGQRKSSLGRIAIVALITSALIGIVSLFLPIVSGNFGSLTYMDDEVSDEGTMLLIGMIVVVVIALLALWKWYKITAWITALVALVVGVISAIDGFHNLTQFSGIDTIDVGVGTYLLPLASVAIILTALIALIAKMVERK